MNRWSFEKSLRKTWGNYTDLTQKFLNEMYSLINGLFAVCDTIEYINQRKENQNKWVNVLVTTHTNKHVPMLLINGVLDPVSGTHAADMFQQKLPSANIVRLQHVGHWPIVESPLLVVSHATKFMQDSYVSSSRS